MKTVMERLTRRFDSNEHRREIEEEVCFHLDMLAQEYLQQDASLAEAKNAALKRFGDVDLVKDQCLEISRRRNPLVPAMKVFLVVVFLVGVLVRINSTDLNLSRMGDLLIVVPILCQILLYVRGWNPSRFPSDNRKSPLMLDESEHPSFTIYDHRKLTPVERVISDK